MKKILLFTLILPCLTIGASAHPITGNRATQSKHATLVDAAQTAETIKGTIKDANGQPLPGVSVSIKGTSQGTQSDRKWRFFYPGEYR